MHRSGKRPSRRFVHALVSLLSTAAVVLTGSMAQGQGGNRCTLRNNDTIERCEVYAAGDRLMYFRGTEEPPEDWTSPDFVEDDRWLEGGTPIGYGEEAIAFETELTDMSGGYLVVFVRASFTIENLSRVTLLRLVARYDDGMAIYLNGQEIDRPNLPSGALTKDTKATPAHEFTERPYLRPFVNDLDTLMLVEGTNVVAVRVHNTEPDSSDAVLDLAVRIESEITDSPAAKFIRGDCDGNGQVGGSPTEAIILLNFAFQGGNAPPCLAACDAEANGSIGIADAVRILRFAFLGGQPPDAPSPECGEGNAGTDADLGCEQPLANCQ